MTTIKEILVPDIGNFDSVEVIEVSIKPGDTIQAEDTLVTLETEKASMDIPSPFSGKIQDLKIKVGDKVSKGTIIALVEVAENASEKSTETATQSAVPVSAKVETVSTPTHTAKNTIKEVFVPDIGNFTSVEVIEVPVKSGDTIQAEDSLLTLETEKASMDIPSPFSGKIQDLKIKVGDKVSQGTLVALIEVAESALAPEKPATTTVNVPATPAPVAPVKAAEPAPQHATVSVDNSGAYAGPATRRLARELGVDLTKVSGTGRKGRVVTTDIHAYVKSILQNQGQAGGFSIEKAPEVDFTQFGEIEVKPLNRIKKWTAKNLHRNWVSIPHVTQFDEADVTELETFRQENKQAAEDNGIKLTPLAFIMKAVVSGLKTYPQFNASLASNGTDLIYKKYFHLGIAVDTPNGLVVPVVRDVDSKGLFDLARELAVISALARDGKLKNEQMSGSCFSISSLGGVGGTAFTPIINAPDVAILGISKVQIRPVYMDNQWVPRKMLPLSLSYDHRVIDGAEGARFVTHVASQLQDIRKLLL